MENNLNFWISKLICPICRDSFKLILDESLLCSQCNKEYTRIPGGWFLIPDTPPAQLQEKWETWTQLQKNGLLSYQLAPELNCLSCRNNPLLYNFVDLLRMQGNVLDVGCGPIKDLPAYFPVNKSINYVGLDPLPVGDTPCFPYFQGLAEALPFVDQIFDQVLFITSLDHFLLPGTAVSEAYRVLKPTGNLYIISRLEEEQSKASFRKIFNIFSKGIMQVVNGLRILGPKRTLKYLSKASRLRIPVGATDFFHMKIPGESKINDWLRDSGFTVIERKLDSDILFLKCRK